MRSLLALVVCLLLAACSSFGPTLPTEGAPHLDVSGFAVPEPGRAIGGRPSSADLRDAADAGYGVVVSFLTEDEGAGEEAALVSEAGMDFVGVPVHGPNLRPEHADVVAAVLADAGETPVLLHCKTGNRAGGVWALYLVRHRGVTVDDAIVEARRLGVSKAKILDAVRSAVAE